MSEQELSLSTKLFALLRTLQVAIAVMGLFYVGLAELLRRNAVRNVSSMLPIISLFAFTEAAVVLYVKTKLVPRAEEKLRFDTEDRQGLVDIRKWYVVALAFSAGVSLYGFALRIMGSTFWQAAIFYAAGIALTLYCTPSKPE
jgi:hypothetical protein